MSSYEIDFAGTPPVTFRRTVFVLGCALLAGCQLAASNNVKVDYYAISGSSTTELDNEIRRKGPRIGDNGHAVAVARIQMFPNVKYTRTGRSCAVRSAKVAVNARVTLPRWTGRGTATRELGAAWDNIDRYTRLHEAVHVAIAFRYAKRMEQTLLTIPTGRTCSDTKAKVVGAVADLLKEHDTAQKQFDADEQSRFAKYATRGTPKLQPGG